MQKDTLNKAEMHFSCCEKSAALDRTQRRVADMKATLVGCGYDVSTRQPDKVRAAEILLDSGFGVGDVLDHLDEVAGEREV